MFTTTYGGDNKSSMYPIFNNNEEGAPMNPSVPPITPPPAYPGAVPTVKFYPQATNSVSPVMGAPATLPIDGPQTTVIVTQRSFGPAPILTKCSFCGNQITTSTDPTSGLMTYCACFVIAIVGCFYGCCLIPFCCDPCKDVEHRCPQCNRHLGTYERLNCSR
jgi:lipopolysaccharide-induced tumor necrosis factor-alpha factor